MKNTIHKGIIVNMKNSYTAMVWIPTAGCAVPLGGRWRALFENTASALSDVNLHNAQDTAKECIIATPLSSGAWFKALPALGASVFNNRYRDGDKIYDYRLATDYVPPFENPIRNLQYKSDTPAMTMCPFSPTLNLSSGTPIPSGCNLPPGTYPQLEIGQHVLVIFPESDVRGIIIASIPSESEWETMLG